jgi:hypothetical protein
MREVPRGRLVAEKIAEDLLLTLALATVCQRFPGRRRWS